MRLVSRAGAVVSLVAVVGIVSGLMLATSRVATAQNPFTGAGFRQKDGGQFSCFSQPGSTDGVQQIVQRLSSTKSRTITFPYNPGYKLLASITYARGRGRIPSGGPLSGTRCRST
jgi:hypothetical protein